MHLANKVYLQARWASAIFGDHLPPPDSSNLNWTFGGRAALLANDRETMRGRKIKADSVRHASIAPPIDVTASCWTAPIPPAIYSERLGNPEFKAESRLFSSISELGSTEIQATSEFLFLRDEAAKQNISRVTRIAFPPIPSAARNNGWSADILAAACFPSFLSPSRPLVRPRPAGQFQLRSSFFVNARDNADGASDIQNSAAGGWRGEGRGGEGGAFKLRMVPASGDSRCARRRERFARAIRRARGPASSSAPG